MFRDTDPSLLLDNVGSLVNAPEQANSSSSAPATTSSREPRAGELSRSISCCWAGCRFEQPIAFYGPFVMNTREEIQQALDDYLAGRLGVHPKILLSCRY